MALGFRGVGCGIEARCIRAFLHGFVSCSPDRGSWQRAALTEGAALKLAGNGAHPSVLRSCARRLPLAGEDETLAAVFESELRAGCSLWRDAFGEGAEIVEPASRVRLAHCDEIQRVLLGDLL